MHILKNAIKFIIVFILRLEARIVIMRYKPYIIGVTGSVGKTSTKDVIYSVISSQYKTRKSLKSFNGDIGIPLTILGLPNAWNSPKGWLKTLVVGAIKCLRKEEYPTHIVLELGVDRPRDMQSIARWLPLDIAIMTRIGALPVHVEFFASAKEVAREKAYIFKALKSQGVAIVSLDDPEVREIIPKDVTLKTYGFDHGAQSHGISAEVVHSSSNQPIGMRIQALYQGQPICIDLSGVIGAHHAYPVLAGLSVAEVLGLTPTQVLQGLARHIPPPGRMNILKGIKDSVIIDDSYNSSPDALREALKTLGDLQVAGRKIAIIGDMLELGKHATEAHRQAGIWAKASVRLVITVGLRARSLEGALHFTDARTAAESIPSLIEERDVILVKGSQGIRLERVVKALLADPSEASRVLARQELEWQER